MREFLRPDIISSSWIQRASLKLRATKATETRKRSTVFAYSDTLKNARTQLDATLETPCGDNNPPPHDESHAAISLRMSRDYSFELIAAQESREKSESKRTEMEWISSRSSAAFTVIVALPAGFAV